MPIRPSRHVPATRRRRAVAIAACAVTLMLGSGVDAAPRGRTLHVQTVPPVTDPGSADWGRQSAGPGADGSAARPYGSLGELLEREPLHDGDEIVLDTATSGIPSYGSHRIAGVEGVTLRGAAGSTARIVNAFPVGGFELIDATGSLPVFGVPFPHPNPIEVVDNWNVNVDHATGAAYGVQGPRFGFLRRKTDAGALSSQRGYAVHDGMLFVSLPAGSTITEHEIMVCQPGHVVLVRDAPDFVARHLSFELATEKLPTNGYGLRADQESPGLIVEHCSFDATQWHSVGNVSKDVTGTRIRHNTVYTGYPGNDDHIVIYSARDALADCHVNDNLVFLATWRDQDNRPYEADRNQAVDAMGVGGIATHTASTASQTTQPGALRVYRNRTVYLGDFPGSRFKDFGAVASNIRFGGRPGDPLQRESYVWQVYDNDFGGHGFSVGGGHDSQVWCAVYRNVFRLQGVELLTNPTGGPGLLVVTGSASTDTGVLFESNTVSGDAVRGPGNKSLVSVGRSSLYMLNNTLLMRGAGHHPNTRLLAFSPQTRAFLARGNIFAAEQIGGIRFATGDWGQAVGEDPAGAFVENWYGPNLHHVFNASVAGMSRAHFESHVDPDGEYTLLPGFVDAATLEPNPETAGLKSGLFDSGPVGINLRNYDGSFGAWQFGGPAQACPADLTGDGSVDIFDLLAYLDLYTVQDPGADLAEPFGTVDLFDLLEFADLYQAGCP